jgi:hypothetical protein
MEIVISNDRVIPLFIFSEDNKIQEERSRLQAIFFWPTPPKYEYPSRIVRETLKNDDVLAR